MIELKKEVIKYAQKLNSTNLSPLQNEYFTKVESFGKSPPTNSKKIPRGGGLVTQVR